ncbi:MAG: hypothetical protein WC748_09660 [Legionellales bacterium]|jgi:hypothetical protein
MKLNKILISSAALIGTALLALVAFADNTLAIKVVAVEGLPDIKMQVLSYDPDRSEWVVEGNINNIVAGGEYEHKRDRVPNMIRIVNNTNGSNWYCKDINGNDQISDVPAITIDKISASPNSCLFSYSGAQSLSLNFYVHGLETGTAAFAVFQYNDAFQSIGTVEEYSSANGWPGKTVTQSMELEYAYAVIEYDGAACKFEDGTDKVTSDLSTIHAAINLNDTTPSCQLSKDAPPAPIDIVSLNIAVTANGLTSEDIAELLVFEYKTANGGDGYKETPYAIDHIYQEFTQVMDNQNYPYNTKMNFEFNNTPYACAYVDSRGTSIDKNLKNIYVDFNQNREDKALPICLLSDTPFTEGSFNLNVNIGELESDPIYIYADPALQYIIYSEEGPITEGRLVFADAKLCSDGSAPNGSGLCVETLKWDGEFHPNHIQLIWFRIKSTTPGENQDVCQYNGSSVILVDELEHLEIFGSDPEHEPIQCEIEVKL